MRQTEEPPKVYDPSVDRHGKITQENNGTVVITWDNGRNETVAKRRLTPYSRHFILDVRSIYQR